MDREKERVKKVKNNIISKNKRTQNSEGRGRRKNQKQYIINKNKMK